ncbi:MAG: ribosome maturation factor RimP [Gammaproteobacteria bacterium]|nr:ribosome maturation factor RimP [Gammaproteobacteria bacterium]
MPRTKDPAPAKTTTRGRAVTEVSGVQTLEQKLTGLLHPSIQMLGYEFVGLEYHAGGAGMLRIYIDQPGGVTIDDCADVSHQVSGVLDVEDPIATAYTLEVSSPGVFRPLMKAEHYKRFAGERVKVELESSHEGRRRFRGTLIELVDDTVVIEEEGARFEFPLSMVARATLDPEL